MTNQEKLYETLGELLYVVAKADGVIQSEELEALKGLLEGHSWAKEIKWSFDYESKKSPDVDELYQKVIAVCDRIGPSAIYTEFIHSMEVISNASNGIDQDESEVIQSFSKDLVERFKKDIKRYYK